MIAPCKDCSERYLGCHSDCEKYKEFVQYRRSMNEARSQAAKREEDYMYARSMKRKGQP